MSSTLAFTIGGMGLGFLAGFLAAFWWACTIAARILGESPGDVARAWVRQ